MSTINLFYFTLLTVSSTFSMPRSPKACTSWSLSMPGSLSPMMSVHVSYAVGARVVWGSAMAINAVSPVTTPLSTVKVEVERPRYNPAPAPAVAVNQWNMRNRYGVVVVAAVDAVYCMLY